MISYFSIVRLTIKTIIRTKFLKIILLLILISSVIMPIYLTGDGSLASEIQVSIEYSLLSVNLILTLSSVWIACLIMNFDIIGYQLHMISVKPIRRSTIWLGKYTGILVIYTILLIISSVIIFFIIKLKTDNNIKYTENIIHKINENIFVGRKSYYPHLTNLEKEYNEELKKQKQITLEANERLTQFEIKNMQRDILYSIISQQGKVPANSEKIFTFKNISKVNVGNIILQYRPYVAVINTLSREKSRTSKGIWYIKHYIKNGDSEFLKLKNNKKIISNNLYKITLPVKNYISPKNVVTLKFKNLDDRQPIFFILSNSPKLKIKYSDFQSNFFRCFLVSFIGLLLIIAISCSVGGIFSFPIAIFCIIAYLMFGSIGSFILSDSSIGNPNMTIETKIGYNLSNVILKGITPIQKFQLYDHLSHGRLIEYKVIKNIILRYVLIQLLAFVTLGIYIYSKKELGSIIKK